MNTVLATGVATVSLWNKNLFFGPSETAVYSADNFALFFKILFLIGLAITIFISRRFLHAREGDEHSVAGEYYALLVGRELAYAADEADRVLRDFFDPLAHAFIDALHAARPQVPRAQVAWAYQFALGALLHHISDARVARLSNGINTPNDAAAAPLLIAFITAGLDAALQVPPEKTQETPA